MICRIILAIIALSCTQLVRTDSAQAAIFWDWEFTNNNAVVTPDSQVTLLGRIFNNSTNEETLGNFSSGSTFYISSADADQIDHYSFLFGPSGLFFNQFSTPIAAGSFQDFTFGKYTPNSSAPEDTYAAFNQSITTRLFATNVFVGEIANCYSWNVNSTSSQGPDGCNPSTNPVVPEPASLLLIGSGLVGAFLQRKKIS